MNDIRIAAAITNSPVNQIKRNLSTMRTWVAAAEDAGAAIICFPELNITGYSTKAEIRESAQKIPGPLSEELIQMATDHQLVILAGTAEKNDEGRIFASHLVVSPGRILGIYRKLHVAPPEQSIFTPGNSIPLFDRQNIKFGIQLCYDAHFPELSTRMAVEGADIIFMPHASPRGLPAAKFTSWMRHLTARAFDNSVFIVACNQTGENDNGLSFPGLAVVITPSGDVLKKKLADEDALMIADLKAKDLSYVREHRMRYFLPNRRPEIYSSPKPQLKS